MLLTLIIANGILIIYLLVISLWYFLKRNSANEKFDQLLIRFDERELFNKELNQNITRLLLEQQKSIIESVHLGIHEIRTQILNILGNNIDLLVKQFEKLAFEIDRRLKEISCQVDKRLAEGFEKTTATFHDVIKRLALIDEAQKKISDLSHNVIGLQEILNDKRSRGAFGEIQLNALIRNVMPESNFALQHTLSNGKRADCILFLPEPSGNVVIDAKFPLEGYRRLIDISLSTEELRIAQNQFRADIKKHIQDIAEKYIIPGETSDGALMFIPAEAVFAEIHAHFTDLIELSHKAKVWLVSPTTMMAILTTARAVIKDEATRKQVHIIQEHLVYLGKDFMRFQTRMDNLAKHVNQAHIDIEEVQKSSKKITNRFINIEKVEAYVDQNESIEN
jgi:DNA recombination protein RmuC